MFLTEDCLQTDKKISNIYLISLLLGLCISFFHVELRIYKVKRRDELEIALLELFFPVFLREC